MVALSVSVVPTLPASASFVAWTVASLVVELAVGLTAGEWKESFANCPPLQISRAH